MFLSSTLLLCQNLNAMWLFRVHSISKLWNHHLHDVCSQLAVVWPVLLYTCIECRQCSEACYRGAGSWSSVKNSRCTRKLQRRWCRCCRCYTCVGVCKQDGVRHGTGELVQLCLWLSHLLCLLPSCWIAYRLVKVCVLRTYFRSGLSSNGNGKHFSLVLHDHGASLLLAYLHLRNTLTYLLTYLLIYLPN